MLDWNSWKLENKDNISHIAGFEEIFIDSILSNIPEISPDDVISQYHFTDFNGKNRYIDFMIINPSKGYQLPIELDGYSKLELERDYSKFNDFLERQNALTSKFGILLRYTNKKMFNEQASIIKEIKDVLNRQNQRLSTEQINNHHIQTTIKDYEDMILDLQNQVESHNSQTESSIHQTIKEIQKQLNNLSNQTTIIPTQSPVISSIPSDEGYFSVRKIIIAGSIFLLCVVVGSLLIKTKLNLHATNVELDTSETKLSAVKESAKISGISADNANQYIGTNQKVCGQIVEVKNFSKGQYLNFNKNFPNQPFTLVIWNSDLANLEKIEPYKELCVTGLIFSYKGKPQMQIKSHNQISTL